MAIFITPGGQFTGGTLASELTLAAGTTSNPPLAFQSGSNLTTPEAGAVEYDGKVIYTTPAGRGVSPSMMLYRLDSNLVGTTATTPQSMFGVGVTLQPSTVYSFQLIAAITKAAGTTSHTFSVGFAGGTATFNNFLANSIVAGLQAAPPVNGNTTAGTAFAGVTNSTASFAYLTGITSAIRTTYLQFFGTFSVANGGTFIPQYTLSANPGGAYTTLAGSSIAIWPIGAAGSNTSVGPWA